MSYRFMRILVMFDMPTFTLQDKKSIDCLENT